MKISETFVTNTSLRCAEGRKQGQGDKGKVRNRKQGQKKEAKDYRMADNVKSSKNK